MNENGQADSESPGAANSSTLSSFNEKDGKIALFFLNNDLEVRGDFYPEIGDGAPITTDYIKELLEKFKINYGLKHDEISAAYTKCTEEKKFVKDVLIASGDAPINEVMEYTQLNPLLGVITTGGKADDSVDHRARSPFIIVKKGEALAKQKSRKPGKEGANVHGEAMGFQTIRPESVTGGENTRMEGKFILSAIHGQMVVSNGVINVSDSLLIKGAVGYSTGNIDFPGNVEIEGPVSDGFKIYTGGSLTIKQTFDVTDVNTKTDLNVLGGIIGRGQALVKVGGSIKTKFIENCRVACRKTITVDSEIIGSNIFTLESLEMGDKGRIVSSEIYALKGLRACSIGKDTGKSSRIHCGIDFALEQEKEKNNNLLRLLAAKLNRLKDLMASPEIDSDKMAKFEAVRERLEEEQQKTQTRITEILGITNNHCDAVIEITGQISPGTLIEICQTSLNVTEPLSKVRIKLERESSKLITEKL